MLLNRTSNAAKNRNNFSKMMISMGQRYPTLRGARHLHHQEASLDHHLAISASRSSSSATAAHLVHSTRLRTLATTVFIRGIATRSGKDSMAQMKVEPDPLPLGEFKKEVTKLIDQEVKESSSALDPAAKFLAEFNYKLFVSDGVATLKRTQGKQVVELSFAVEEDEEGDNEEKEEEEESEEEEEETAEEFQARDVDPLMGVQDLYIPTEVKITIVDKDKEVSSMSLACSAFESRFFIDTLYSADGKNSVHFEQLSDGLQEKIYDYLESLKLDHRLGTFIFEYTRNYHAHKSAQVLSDLKQFVSHLRDE